MHVKPNLIPELIRRDRYVSTDEILVPENPPDAYLLEIPSQIHRFHVIMITQHEPLIAVQPSRDFGETVRFERHVAQMVNFVVGFNH